MVERREAHDVLAAALAESREALSTGAARSNGGELELIDELLTQLRAQLEPDCPADELAAWLAASAGPNGERRDALGDVIGLLARRLPRSGESWQALMTALDQVFGSGVQALGRLPFVSDALLELMRAEARQQLPEREGSSRPAPGPPGRALASLAVSPKLVEAVTSAFGFAVVPTYDAVYLYDPPGSHVRTHVDTRDYELVFHLILEHTLPGDGSPGSALVAHLPAKPGPTRLAVGPGEAVALRGRGTIHSWEPLHEDEDRIMVAIGFASAP